MQQKLALALALGLSSVLAQDVVSAETPLNRYLQTKDLIDTEDTVLCYVPDDDVALYPTGERPVPANLDPNHADVKLCKCMLLKDEGAGCAWCRENTLISDYALCGTADTCTAEAEANGSCKPKEMQRTRLELALEMCTASINANTLNCDILDKTGVGGAADVCAAAEDAMDAITTESTTLREFLQCIFAHQGDSTSDPPAGCEELTPAVIMDYAWKLLQDQWMWLLPMVFLIFFIICLMFIIPMTCCCFKSCCYKFRCRNICCCDICYTDSDPNKAPRWSMILRITMVGSMFLFTIVGIAIVFWANLTFLPKLTGGIESTMCDAANMINIVNYGDVNHAVPLADQRFIGFEPATDIFDNLQGQLTEGSALRTDVDQILSDMSQLTIATTEVNLKIDVMLSYADDNVAPPTNTIVSDFIKNFPSDDMTKVQTELSEGTAAQVDQINKDLAEFWDGDQVDDLNTQLDDATKPMTDMQEQLDEVGELFVGDGRDIFENFQKYAGDGLTAVGGVFGVFTLIAFILAFLKVFVFEFDQGSYHADDPNNQGGCCGPRGKRHPIFGSICALTCCFALLGLLVGGLILLLTVPVSESCLLVDELLYSPTPYETMSTEIPLLVPGEPNDDLLMIIDMAANCVAEQPADPEVIPFTDFESLSAAELGKTADDCPQGSTDPCPYPFIRVATSGKVQVASALEMTETVQVDDGTGTLVTQNVEKYMGAFVWHPTEDKQFTSVDECVAAYAGKESIRLRPDPSILNALNVNFDVNAEMSKVTGAITDLTASGIPKMMEDQGVIDFYASVQKYGKVWRFTDDAVGDITTQLVTELTGAGIDPTNLGSNPWLLAFATQSGNLFSDDATVTIDSGDGSNVTLNHLKNLMNDLSGDVAAGTLGLGQLDDMCLGLTGANLVSPISCPTVGYTALKDLTITGTSTAAVHISKKFGQALYDAFNKAVYTCSTVAGCTPIAMQNDLDSIDLNMQVSMTSLDTVTVTLVHELEDKILEALNTHIVAPTQMVLDMMNCQAFGAQVRYTMKNMCDDIYPGLRGLATAWAFLGFMGCICGILMYFIWHHLKVKYIWENTHSHPDHYDGHQAYGEEISVQAY